jgi:hypothetical protein
VTVAERFWSKVDKTADCWLWQGSKSNGYGYFYLNGKNTGAHRVAYEMLCGPIPDGLVLDHLCQAPACVNPDHLEPVTHQENIRRGPRERYGANRYKTHCSRGHKLSGDNVADQGGGRRRCVICRQARDRNRVRIADLRAINAELYAKLTEILPHNVCLTNRNIPDDMAVPLECTMGDLRRISAVLAKARGEQVQA